MNKKPLISLAALLLCSSMAMADEYQYLALQTGQEETSIELAQIRKITFDSENVHVLTTEGDVTLPLAEMQRMYFSATPVAIASLPMESGHLHISDGLLRAEGQGLLHIYASNGQLVRMAHIQGQQDIRLQGLPQGTYIISLGEETIKIRR